MLYNKSQPYQGGSGIYNEGAEENLKSCTFRIF